MSKVKKIDELIYTNEDIELLEDILTILQTMTYRDPSNSAETRINRLEELIRRMKA